MQDHPFILRGLRNIAPSRRNLFGICVIDKELFLYRGRERTSCIILPRRLLGLEKKTDFCYGPLHFFKAVAIFPFIKSSLFLLFLLLAVLFFYLIWLLPYAGLDVPRWLFLELSWPMATTIVLVSVGKAVLVLPTLRARNDSNLEKQGSTARILHVIAWFSAYYDVYGQSNEKDLGLRVVMARDGLSIALAHHIPIAVRGVG
jgi:hypothetical protein